MDKSQLQSMSIDVRHHQSTDVKIKLNPPRPGDEIPQSVELLARPIGSDAMWTRAAIFSYNAAGIYERTLSPFVGCEFAIMPVYRSGLTGAIVPLMES